MAPKAQRRSRTTTRPKLNAAHIAHARARRPARGDDDSSSSSQERAPAPKKKARQLAREAKTEVRRGRFLVLVGFMAALGFSTVYLADGAMKAVANVKELGEGTTLWSKIKDRLLDRDIPAVDERPLPKGGSSTKVARKPAAAKPLARAVEPATKAPLPSTPRAELPALSPAEYARETSSEARREQAAAESRARLDALLEKVAGGR